MSWNYRVMKHVEDEVTWYGIHEVFYNDKDQIVAWSKEPQHPFGISFKEIINSLTMMLNDAKKYNILDYDMEAEGQWDIDEDDCELVDFGDSFKEENNGSTGRGNIKD